MTKDYPTIENLIGLVYEETGVDPRYIMGKSRVPRIALARQMVMFLAREHTDYSYPRIGTALCRHHTTVMHGFQSIHDLCDTDEKLLESLTKIKARVRAGAISNAVPVLLKSLLPDDEISSKQPARALMRHRHQYHYGRPKSGESKRKIPCITCKRPFISEGFGHRMCKPCRTSLDALGLPEGYIGTVA